MAENPEKRRRAFNRLSDRAKRALAVGGTEAARVHRDVVEPEHVLLALLTCGGISATALEEAGLQVAEVRRTVQAITGQGDKRDISEVRPSPATRTIVELAADEADRAGQGVIEPEHLLLALLRQPGSAAQVLASFRISGDEVRQKLASVRGG